MYNLLSKVLIFTLFSLHSFNAYSNAASKKLTKVGVGYLSNGKFERALSKFKAATGKDSKDGNANFLQAVSLERVRIIYFKGLKSLMKNK